MQTRNLFGKRGFSTILLLVLGAVFFLIAMGFAYQVSSDNDQLVKSTRLRTSDSRLNFMAYAMQADFNNVYLQGAFEDTVANFLESKEHTINPEQTFTSSPLRSELESYMGEQAGSLITGDAAQVYADAYGSGDFPGVSCQPWEHEGSGGGVTLEETGGGVLQIQSWIVGRRVSCTDAEDGTETAVILEARDYRLTTRAIAIYNKAVESIRNAKLQLTGLEGSYVYGAGQWQLRESADGRNRVLQDWMGDTRLVAMTVPTLCGDTDGIFVVPDSMRIKSGSKTDYTVNDLHVECYGSMTGAYEGRGIAAQTCRPEGLQLVIGQNMSQNTKGLNLSFKNPTGSGSTLQVTLSYFGISVSFPVPVINRLIGPLIWDLLTKSVVNGYVTYSGVTPLCNAFKGKPDQTTIAGEVLETNTMYIPEGRTQIKFDYVSTPQSGLGGSDISNDETCDGQDDIIKENLLALITNYGTQPMQINITKGANGNTTVSQQSIDQLAQTVASNDMYTTTGESKTVTVGFSVTVNGRQVNSGQGSAQVQTTFTPAAAAIGGGSVAPSVNTRMTTAAGTGPTAALTEVTNLFNQAASEVATLGHTLDSQAFTTASSATCKMVAINNAMEMNDLERALAAVCGLSNLFNIEQGRKICNLAGLYQAIKTGSYQAVLTQLGQLIGDTSLGKIMQVAGAAIRMQEAIKTGSLESVLQAAADLGINTGETGAARVLAGAATVAYALEHGISPMQALAAFAGILGAEDLSQFYNAAMNLQAAAESGDVRAMLTAAGEMARQFGYSGLAQFDNLLTQGENIVNLVTNFDQLLEQCKSVPWDVICVVPMVGGGVCEDNWGSCVFSYGMPSFQIDLLCNDLVFDLGFQIDCTCMYTCPSGVIPIAPVPKSVRINLNEILMYLNPEMYENRFRGAAAGAGGALAAYCGLDP